MPFVLTVDQIGSRRQGDLVDHALAGLIELPVEVGFTRTVGDEFQGVLSDPVSVVTAIVVLMRNEPWHIGIGVGPVELPLPVDSRRGRGPAFVAAREAVERAKTDPQHVAVSSSRGLDDPDRADAETVLRLLGDLLLRRTPAGWQAVDLVDAGLTQQVAAERLGITRQAVNQRLLAARHDNEQAARVTAARLLQRAERVTR